MRKLLIIFFLILGYLLFWANFTAIGVIVDTRFFVVILSGILVSIFSYFLIKERKPYYYLTLFLSLILLILSVREYYFLYDESEITFQNDRKDFYGTLYQPKFKKSKCVIVFIHGSGSETRKEYAFHARHLARQGIASFTYDKRGSGKSGGETYEVGYSGYANDAISAIKKIKSQNSFEKVGLFAVSEGEWVSLIVDSLEKIDFILMVSASGTSPFQQSLRELTYRLERKNFSDQDVEEAKSLYQEILAFDNDSLKRVQLENKIMESQHKAWFEAGEDFSTELYYYPWWHKVMNFNPKEYLDKTDTNILVLIGNDNQSFPPLETISNFEGYKNIKVVKFDKGDHSLLEWKFGEGIPPPFFVKEYLKTYSDWIITNCNKN
ncbi:S9 family peptidase [Gramella sp. KN1008]|uniref:alpha/beta hydrolase family protein n=1 Tax=Gramella sp. KN1008 TaxID=2529298 RepID=UPI0010397F24|nr:alpha/beta hydrolase [Gramella sp. KN1008]TBW30013.1 hypothetical protein EZJ28_01005 [Gramella sp. KN1008]